MQALKNPAAASALRSHGAQSRAVRRAVARARVAVVRSQSEVATRAAAGTELVDPVTGQVIKLEAVDSLFTGRKLAANGLTWAYRRTNVPEDQKIKSLAPVVMLHGIGSASYTYRNLLKLFEALKVDALAPDWVGHGDSEAPPPSQFNYSRQAYMDALDAFFTELQLEQPMNLVVQGFVLSQYALLYALQHPDRINRMVILNAPLNTKSQLRPELAPYKNPLPFLRPGKKPFAADIFAATGNIYPIDGGVADNLVRPYLSGDSYNTALAQTMEALDWQGLLREVDSGYRSWPKRTLLLFGTKDPFCSLKDSIEFLDTKRTTMRFEPMEAKLGHNPQEDDALSILKPMVAFFNGENDDWTPSSELLRVGKLWANKRGFESDVVFDDSF